MLVARFLDAKLVVNDIVNYVNVDGTRPGHDLRYALDGKKLENLGWKPPVEFEHSLRLVVS